MMSSDRFNGKHVIGFEEYEDELRKKLTDDSVEGAVGNNSVPSVPHNGTDGFWDKRQAKEALETLEAGSDRLYERLSG